jgi:anti-sigma factor ChrR (cupin superfamily)
MRVAAPVNADPLKIAMVDTNTAPWEATEWPGIERMVLEFVSDPKKGRETSLLRFSPGASLPKATLDDRLDYFVVDGAFEDEHGSYGAHTFVRNPPGFTHTLRSPNGGTLYAKWRVPFGKEPVQRQVIDSKTAQWLDFPHRGASVLHLYPNKTGIETSRIGNVHPGRKLPSHDHSIGEETFVLKGCLKDEYTAYGQGIWFRMPCGVPHAPYTEATEGALMLIREGDMVW